MIVKRFYYKLLELRGDIKLKKINEKGFVLIKKNDKYCYYYANALTEYRRFYNYCKVRDIRSVNCSSTSMINSIAWKEFNNILSWKIYE